MPAEESIDPAIFDAVQFEIVQRLILPARLRAHLHDLDQQMLALVGATGQALQDRAHKIISQAGMLGLMRLSARARALEDACRTGDDTAVALLECHAAAHDVRLYAIPAIGVTSA